MARTRSGRPRDDTASKAILHAANAMLEEDGIAGFSIEAVAARAGVGKATIYRWWPSRGALAVAGFLAETAPKISYPETGSALQDLVAQLRLVASVYGGVTGRVMAAIIAEGQRDPHTMAAFIAGYVEPRRNEAKQLLRAAIDRGELRSGLDVEVVLDALYGPIYYRLLVPMKPLDAAWIELLATEVLQGLAPSPPTRLGPGQPATSPDATSTGGAGSATADALRIP